jgi:gamma-glutamyltranspeptidase/glutathione hydrolase
MLRAGGHAVDAAIAANAALGVVMPNACGLGGDAFWLIWEGNGTPGAVGRQLALNGSGRSPGGTDAARLRREGLEVMPTRGPRSVTIPGAVRSWATRTDASAGYRWRRCSRRRSSSRPAAFPPGPS